MRQQRLSSIQISARAPSGCDQSPLARSAAHQSATIRAPHHNAPQMCNQKLRERAHFLFTITKGPRVITQGENFTTEYFYRLPSMIQRVLLEKERTGTGHQPSDVGVSAAFLSIRVSKGKRLPMTLRTPLR
jgi:hypothetical protein